MDNYDYENEYDQASELPGAIAYLFLGAISIFGIAYCIVAALS